MEQLTLPLEFPHSCPPSPPTSSSTPQQGHDNSARDHSRDAALLRMQSWQSKLDGRNSLAKRSEMVPVGIKGDSLGQYHHRALWTDAEIEQVLSLYYDDGMCVTEIARIMEMPRSTVWAVCHGKLRGKTPEGWRRKNV